MTLDSLEKLGDDELRGVIARCDVLLKQHDTQRKDKAMAEARAPEPEGSGPKSPREIERAGLPFRPHVSAPGE